MRSSPSAVSAAECASRYARMESLPLKTRKAVILDRDRCMECGACVSNCAFGALNVNKGVGCACCSNQQHYKRRRAFMRLQRREQDRQLLLIWKLFLTIYSRSSRISLAWHLLRVPWRPDFCGKPLRACCHSPDYRLCRRVFRGKQKEGSSFLSGICPWAVDNLSPCLVRLLQSWASSLVLWADGSILGLLS